MFQQDNAPAASISCSLHSRASSTRDTEFTSPDMWPASSPDRRPLDYRVCSACIEYHSAIRSSCSSGLLRHGLNFSRERSRKHVSMQKMATLNTCCDGAYLTSQLLPITTGSFQTTIILRNATYLQPDK